MYLFLEGGSVPLFVEQYNVYVIGSSGCFGRLTD
jgi:hypothetical protein